jgi:ABC-type thiamin/hydroxymethylpyrimidine transport system permease subunit
MQRPFAGFTTRSLLACVVLGAFTAAFVHLSRVFGVLLWSTAPWLGAPAPFIPWFLTIILAGILIPRFGSALITSLIGAVVGIGSMAFVAGIVAEIVFTVARAQQRRRGTESAPAGDRRWLVWSIVAGIAIGLVSYGMMFTVAEFRLLSSDLMLLALGIRLVAGAAWGVIAYLLAKALLRAGLNLEGTRWRRPATASSTSDFPGEPI